MGEFYVSSVRTRPVLSEEEKDNKKSFFEKPEGAPHVHGDASNFSGEPSSARGDVWHALDIDVEAFIPQCVEKGEVIGPFNLSKTGKKIAYFDYPTKSFPLQMRSLAVEGEEGYTVMDMYPLMEGFSTEARLVAWFDAADCTGYISTKLSNGVAMDFFAPSYAAMQVVFSPDATYALYISGVAVQLEKAPYTEFEVTKGEFYESQLEEFLNDNPGKTASDFAPPVVSLVGGVGGMPTKYTCEWDLFATVLEVSEYSFETIPYYRLLMPVARGQEGEDVLAYIYVGKKQLKDFEPKKGDVVQGIIWLCADFGNKK